MHDNSRVIVKLLYCPNCNFQITEPQDACPQCNLTLGQLDSLAGTVPRHDLLVCDYQGVLNDRESRSLTNLVKRLNHRFPQSNFSVLLFPVPIPSALYGFWLLNRGKRCAPTSVYGRNFSVLLLVDAYKKTATLTVGYGLERLLSREELQSCLEKGAGSLAAGKYAAGLRGILKATESAMRAIAHGEPIERLSSSSQPEPEEAF